MKVDDSALESGLIIIRRRDQDITAFRNLVHWVVDVVVVVDPDILGGVVAQVGDTVFDGSVRTRLEKMKERLS